MKARVKATGEIVNIIRNSAFDKGVFYASNGQTYNRGELSFDIKEKSFSKDEDYWTRLEHQYAGMAMQGILSRSGYEIFEDLKMENWCVKAAHALVEKMKQKEE